MERVRKNPKYIGVKEDTVLTFFPYGGVTGAVSPCYINNEPPYLTDYYCDKCKKKIEPDERYKKLFDAEEYGYSTYHIKCAKEVKLLIKKLGLPIGTWENGKIRVR